MKGCAVGVFNLIGLIFALGTYGFGALFIITLVDPSWIGIGQGQLQSMLELFLFFILLGLGFHWYFFNSQKKEDRRRKGEGW